MTRGLGPGAVALVLLGWLACAGCRAMGPAVFVSPDEAEALRHRPDVRVLHVGHGRRGFENGRLPDARYVDFSEALVRDGKHIDIPDADTLAVMLGRVGYRPGDRLLLVGDAIGIFPARLWIALRAHGITDVCLLDGHTRHWILSGRPVERGPAEELEVTAQPRPLEPDAAADLRGPEGGADVFRLSAAELPADRPADFWRQLIPSVKDPRIDWPAADRFIATFPRGARIAVADDRGMHAPLLVAILRHRGVVAFLGPPSVE